VKLVEDILTQLNIWNSLLFAALKVFRKEKVKDKIYLYIDFKEINEKTKAIEYIILTTTKLFARMCRIKIFSKLDLATTFYQIPVEKKSQKEFYSTK
jgi:hypothetical protein